MFDADPLSISPVLGVTVPNGVMVQMIVGQDGLSGWPIRPLTPILDPLI